MTTTETPDEGTFRAESAARHTLTLTEYTATARTRASCSCGEWLTETDTHQWTREDIATRHADHSSLEAGQEAIAEVSRLRGVLDTLMGRLEATKCGYSMDGQDGIALALAILADLYPPAGQEGEPS